MPDDLTRRRPEDPTKINIHQSYEVGYWTARLGVSEAVLQRAVNAVGPTVVNVQKWLREQGYA
ncbi:DUF3606 domain-containing protein [Leptolyngbya sp. GB1-A1]|uniref:DUF3606 domain-containing protein n=1 Tax=Leptolyngbya sp. GB1-A1 TaxID=2933908 RepID=UPI00329961F0